MLLKERTYRACKSCGFRHLTGSDVYGCDTCRKKIDMNKKDTEYLEATVFRTSGESAQHMHFCSWRCVLQGISKVKSDYFISLPFLHFDNDTSKGLRAKDFFALMRPTENTSERKK